MFLVAGKLGGTNEWDELGPRKPLMSADQVRTAARMGIEIGSHAVSHVRLSELDADVVRREVIESRERLEAVVEAPVRGFCYPYGDVADALELVRNAGYEYAVATRTSARRHRYAFLASTSVSATAPSGCTQSSFATGWSGGISHEILHIITGLAAGGAEQQLRLLLRHQQDAEVVTLTNPGIMAEAIQFEGTIVHHLGMRANTDAVALPRLVRLVRAGRFDVVHAHLYRACVYGRVAARLAGLPVVATEHSLGISTSRAAGSRRASAGSTWPPTSGKYDHCGLASRAAVVGVGCSGIACGADPQRDRGRSLPVRCSAACRSGAVRPLRTTSSVAVGRLQSGKRFDVLLRS